MKQYIVGIDLGTSNTVVAYVETGTDEIRIFDIDQLVGLGEVGTRELLPSVRYHSAPGELAAGDLQLPWIPNDREAQPAVIGHLARALGAQVPGRLVTSAKSWLSHASVDRLAPILPWGADDQVSKVSPVTASASYLAHVRAAWNHRFPHALLEDQDVVLTVPASFDDGARALTLEAARIAKLPALRLLEEPQAAFYDWLFHHRATLAAELAQTRLVLVCDVGGGTTDLTLIKVHFEDGEPQLTRIGVGNHLMLGGDNMDLALAHLVETRLAKEQTRLSAASLSQLVERCRAAKEQLLGAQPPDSVAITLLGAGARLVGGARTTELSREEVEQIIVEGSFRMAVLTNCLADHGPRSSSLACPTRPMRQSRGTSQRFCRASMRSRVRRWGYRMRYRHRCRIPCCSTAACSGRTRFPVVWRMRSVRGGSSLCMCCKTTIPTWLLHVVQSLTD